MAPKKWASAASVAESLGPTGEAPVGEDGTFERTAVSPGKASVFARWRPSDPLVGRRAQFLTLYVQDGQSETVDFNFVTGDTRLEGIVTANDKPQPGLFYSVVYEYGGGLMESIDGHTTDDGKIILEALPPGPCTIAVFPPGAQGLEQAVRVDTVIEDGVTTRQDVAYTE